MPKRARPPQPLEDGHYTVKTKKAKKNTWLAGGQLPPVDSKWDWSKFHKRMPLHEFFQALLAQREIILSEIATEVRLATEHNNHYITRKSYVKILSWSTVAAVEWVYDQEDCYSTDNCLQELLSEPSLVPSAAYLQRHILPLLPDMSGMYHNKNLLQKVTGRSASFATTLKDKMIKGLKKWLLPYCEQKSEKKLTTNVEYQAVAGATGYLPDQVYQAWVTKEAKLQAALKQAVRTSYNQLNPVVIKEEEIHALALYLMTQIGLWDWHAGTNWETARPKGNMKKPNPSLFVTEDGKKVTEQGVAAAMLLQLCIGSRLKGILLANKITKANLKLEQDKHSWMYNAQDHMLRVERLSKEGRPSRKLMKKNMEREILANEDESNDVPEQDSVVEVNQVLVKPTLHMFLTGTEFLELFTAFRQALFKNWTTREGNSSSTSWPLSNEKLYSKAAKIFVIRVGNQCRSVMSEFFKARNQSHLLKHNNGTHLLRKIYVAYGYQLFASNHMKDVAFAQSVLGHKSLNTSVMYTDLMVRLIIRPSVQFDKHVSATVATLKAEIDELKHMIAQLPQKPSRLPYRRFTQEEKDSDLDVFTVISAMEPWKDLGITPTVQNMREILRIGTDLVAKTRRHVWFTEYMKQYNK